ncbi:c-type cytochrome [Rhizobium laguerreae]|uniref:c-type cytochrome n=1 Tax=Rhizobium laguerreae TaxID=1076926 RepID=UPI001C91F7F1|nr:c-type cytochrome [Rhizobium laguerreae]MBY3157706.1 c-type cytochrome [Rhizobium laguerreae]
MIHPTAPSPDHTKVQAGTMLRVFIPLVGLLLPFSTSAQEADGERLFQQRCAACHNIEQGPNKMGPPLLGVVGRVAGSVEGANYSDAMRSSGITWDPRSLDTFLAAPRQIILGTRMTVSIPDAAQRTAIIEYLESQSPD